MSQQLFQFQIPVVKDLSNEEGESIDITLNEGQTLFVIGANGTGKSALMQMLHNTQPIHTVWIESHRQSSFPLDVFDLPFSKIEGYKQQMIHSEGDISSRFRTRDFSRVKLFMRSLIHTENNLNQEIASRVRQQSGADEYASRNPSVLSVINDLLKIAYIPIKILIKNNRLFAMNTKTTAQYESLALSDGERNALWIACGVLTAEKNQLIIIDEPERHLHRSIISPFLSALFAERKDCSFILSTHEVYLPIDNPDASVLLLRGCKWENNLVSRWDANLLEAGNNIPDDVKKQILGPKRKILFVEGNNTSLDKQLYQTFYENVTVIPVGSCVDVEQRVKAMRKAGEENRLHWLNVYGVIDGDGKTAEHKDKLKQNNIVALPCYSVESLYYRTEIVKRMAEKYASTFGIDAECLYQKSLSNIAEKFEEVKEKLCAMKVAHKIRMLQVSPTWEDVIENNYNQNPQCDSAEIFTKEKEKFDNLIKCKDWNALIEQYPIKESGVLANISHPFKVSNKKGKQSYEHLVRELVRQDENGIKAYYKNELLKDLTELIESDSE